MVTNLNHIDPSCILTAAKSALESKPAARVATQFCLFGFEIE